MDTTTTATGELNLTIPPSNIETTQDATTLLQGTLTGLVLWPFTSTTVINSCIDASPSPYVCNLVPLGLPGYTSAGLAPITFDITPGGTTVFSDSQDVGAIAGYASGWVIINTTSTLTAVPEPSTGLLSLVGMIGLTVAVRHWYGE